MTRIRALIVDDEPLARERIRGLLGDEPDVEVCGECAHGLEAVDAIERIAPDLVFLDIRMPELDGLGVVDAVGTDRMPLVIFVTAYDEFALAAFDRHALDYVLKPIDPERFRRTVRRAVEWVRTRREGEAAASLRQLIEEIRSQRPRPERLVVRRGARVSFVRIDEIRWISAAGNYVEIHVPSGEFLLRRTLQELERELDPRRFLRIHRSTIVSVDHVREIRPEGRGDGEVVLDDGTKLPLSRTYRERIDDLLGRSF